ncbi:energy transducer TonB [Lewinella sp. JB7]|nr:energy transducer TonB [Lewinella sp. JB7]
MKYEDRWMIYRDSELHGDEEQLIFRSPEKMPKFSDCDEGEVSKKGMKCDMKEMLDFIFDNIVYPQEAIAAKIEGMVVVKFIVEKDGTLTNAEVVREIGGGCGEEAVKVVERMNPWIPGTQDGDVVRTAFYLPVRFAL